MTNGHLDIIGRASRLFDEVVVAVLINQSKSGLFKLDERLDILAEVTNGYSNVRVEAFQGLLVDFCRSNDIEVIVKGVRVASDFDYELQMAQMNIGLSGIETLFMPTNPHVLVRVLEPDQGRGQMGRRRHPARPRCGGRSAAGAFFPPDLSVAVQRDHGFGRMMVSGERAAVRRLGMSCGEQE